MRNYIKFLVFTYVFIGFSICRAGSYEDFFLAIDKDNAVVVESLLQRGFDPNTVNPRRLAGTVGFYQGTSAEDCEASLGASGTQGGSSSAPRMKAP